MDDVPFSWLWVGSVFTGEHLSSEPTGGRTVSLCVPTGMKIRSRFALGSLTLIQPVCDEGRWMLGFSTQCVADRGMSELSLVFAHRGAFFI